MKFFSTLTIGVLFCIMIQIYQPYWWAFLIIPFLIGIIIKFQNYRTVYFLGFCIAFSAWFILYQIKDFKNEHLLSEKMAEIFSLPSALLLFLLSSFLMGLISGLAAISGAMIRKREKQ